MLSGHPEIPDNHFLFQLTFRKDIPNMFSTKDRMIDILMINSPFFYLLGIRGYQEFFSEVKDAESFYSTMAAMVKTYKQPQKKKEEMIVRFLREISQESLVEMSI